MRSMNFLLAAIAVLAMSATSNADVLIGGTTGNGDFQHNFVNNVEGDTVAWGIGARNAADTANLAMTSSSIGRAFIGSSTTNETFRPNSWIATRNAYFGNNNAWGFDAGNTAFGTPNVYYFMNSGRSTLVHTPVAGTFLAGETFDLNYSMWQQGTSTNFMNVTGTLDFAGGETHTFSTSTASGVQMLTNFASPGYTLLANSSSVTLTLVFETGSNGVGGGGQQSLLDNVVLNRTAVPEPGSLALLGLVGLGLVARRRK